MAHFPVCTFLEEVSTFEKQDFEDAWSSAWNKDDLGLDFDLFPSNDTSFSMDFGFNDSNNNIDDDPMLTSAAAGLDFENLLGGPCSPVHSCDDDDDTEFNLVAPQDVYPAHIHSYCQQPLKQEAEETLDDEDLDEDLKPMQQDESLHSNEENVTPPRDVSVRRSSRRRRQRRAGNKRRTVSSDDEAVIFSNGKPKLYSQKPFNNPDMEKARLNAINAKLNRERKKQEAANLKRELERLRRENEELKKAKSTLNNRASRAEEELSRIKQVLERADLVNVLKWSSGK